MRKLSLLQTLLLKKRRKKEKEEKKKVVCDILSIKPLKTVPGLAFSIKYMHEAQFKHKKHHKIKIPALAFRLGTTFDFPFFVFVKSAYFETLKPPL